MLERTLVEVISEGLLKFLLACPPYKHQRNEEQDKRATYPPSICNELLRVFLKDNNYDDRYGYNDAPHPFDYPSIIL